MPPRISLLQCFRAQTNTPATSTRSISSSSSLHASTVAQRRRYRDPYAIAQAKARKVANLSRQEVLKTERAAALGDPVRGTTTPYVESFDTALPPRLAAEGSHESHTRQTATTASSQRPIASASGLRDDNGEHLNFFLMKDELEKGLTRSRWLSAPKPGNQPRQIPDFDVERLSPQQLEERDTTATEAIRRIASLSLGSSKDLLRVNKQRCIATFGRHNTDRNLLPKPPSTQFHLNPPEKTPRVGPDTGSSEVQIAILTAKIRTLADFLGSRGTMDKVNKRNLRLLVHRRAKLLKYLRRKERGGPRWQNLVETLGLVDGTWKGEITM